MDQPQPQANRYPSVWDLVMQDMARRDHLGKSRYGVRLQPHNGRRSIVDLYEELLDAVVYTRQHIYEEHFPEIDTVYLDMDGVLVDFVTGALQVHGAGPEKMIPGVYDMCQWLNLSLEDFRRPLGGQSFWQHLPWMSDGMAVLQLVLDHVPEKMLWLVSDPLPSPGCYAGKYLWLRSNLAGLSDRLVLAQDKSFLARPGALLIDDHTEAVDSWRERGGEAILVPRPWNHRRDARPFAVLALELAEQAPRIKKA